MSCQLPSSLNLQNHIAWHGRPQVKVLEALAVSGRADMRTFPFEMYDINIWGTIDGEEAAYGLALQASATAGA